MTRDVRVGMMRLAQGVAGVVVVALLFLPSPAPAQGPRPDAEGTATPKPIRRTATGVPDLEGFYQHGAGGSNYGLEQREASFLTPANRGIVVDPPDGKLPFQEWARAETASRAQPERGYDDPTAHCFPAGVPRSLYVPSPFEIVQTPEYVLMMFERMSWRIIPLDGRTHLPDNIRLWQGDSVGLWEGDTLVVESKNFNGKTWLNQAGEVVTHALHVVERITPVNADRLDYRATITDPLAYSQPFTIAFPLTRQDGEMLEVACLEDDQDLKHLKDIKDEAIKLGKLKAN